MQSRASAHDLIHRARYAIGLALDQKLADLNLTSRQLLVLAAVSTKEGASQTHLVNATGIDRSTMADLVRRLIKKDLLQRVRAVEDRRAYSVSLTNKGRLDLSNALQIASSFERGFFVAHLDVEARAFLLHLRRVVDDMSSCSVPCGVAS
jgi:DNA-binding MarR family transcriptional regulator